MPPLDLLPELLDEVFFLLPCRREYAHQVQDDQRRNQTDLLSCSLVSRRWRGAARRHIFHTTSCAFDRVNASDSEPKRDADGPDRRTLQEFADFLQASPHVCALIRRLDLVSLGAPNACPRTVDRELVYSMLALLPGLQYLMLEKIILHSPDPTPPAVRFSISTLDLREGYKKHMGLALAVLTAVNMFESIGTLHIKNARIPYYEFEMGAAAFPATRVASLSLGVFDNSAAVRCISPRHLKSLCIPALSFMRDGSDSFWEETLSDGGFGKGLEHLSFLLYEGGGEFLSRHDIR